MTPNSEQRTINHNIGFVFLCPLRGEYCHNILSNKNLCQFCLFKPGFVFSNEHKSIRHMGISHKIIINYGFIVISCLLLLLPYPFYLLTYVRILHKYVNYYTNHNTNCRAYFHKISMRRRSLHLLHNNSQQIKQGSIFVCEFSDKDLFVAVKG